MREPEKLKPLTPEQRKRGIRNLARLGSAYAKGGSKAFHEEWTRQQAEKKAEPEA
jgi:hypothetical protein